MAGGWVKLYQKLLDDPAFFNSTPAQFKVFVTVLLLVTWTPYKWDVLGHEFTLQPGRYSFLLVTLHIELETVLHGKLYAKH